ncbi:PucR family transcriptional regulator [Amycolatopsis cihanbeyliensis]|uniref:CdaR family transcriptional regulator n=1 Tax=Amycolatopsis cihanbeyliensis TaxID=1128664 RepID=A0A542DK37_AMYCI|nr:PucR family transcriptional regulator [Amycolatopsis cihanbeyliensis]TQJ03457.1 CdaR family transcriptional regulator [Amycolatopsis cihanbeyliensis]
MVEDARPAGGVTLRQLLVSIGEPLVDLHVAATGLDLRVRGMSILDPDDEPGGYPAELVLVIGARGRDAIRFVRAAARGGAVAAAVKAGPEGQADELREAAAEAGIALLAVRPGVRWEQLETLVREVLDSAILSAGFGEDLPYGDLFSLAQTVAVLTGGSVSIEDAGNRVLAYSRSDDEVDELRRLSILGWEGPEAYLAMLREWGIFQRLRSGEEVVRIDEHPELGIRRRLAIGIRAGSHHLGTIWVQEGREPFADRAERALVGASRMAAVQLLRHRSDPHPGGPGRELLPGLLEGRASADLVAGHLGLDPATPASVLAFALPAEPDLPAHELRLVETGTVVSVHVTSFRRAALVGTLGSRVYAVLPDVTARQERAVRTLATDIVDVLRRRVGTRVQAGIGSPVATLGEVATSRAEADRVLDAMVRRPQARVATIAELRAEVLLGETLSLLAGKPDLRDPGVAALREHDTAHGSDLVGSLLAYLDAMGDVRSAAGRLHIHPNTLRHRVRRARTVSGIDLDDPRARLSCHLQLLLAVRADGGAA